MARVLDTGLTLTGATHVEATPAFPHGRITQTTTNFQSNEYRLAADAFNDDPLELALQESLELRNDVTAVIGDNVAGFVVWSEV